MTIFSHGWSAPHPTQNSNARDELNRESTNEGYPSRLSRLFHFGQLKMASRDDIRREMRANEQALEAERAKLVRKHPNEFVLMRAGEVVGFFASLEEAQAAGMRRFRNRLFSLHELRAQPHRVGGSVQA